MDTTTFCALLATVLIAAAAQGAVSVEITGGGGSPLTLTLHEPVSYTISPGAPEDDVPVFIFQQAVTGPVMYYTTGGTLGVSLNGGEIMSFNPFMISGYDLEDTTSADIQLPGPILLLQPGDVLTLHPGYLTTDYDVATIPTGAGSLETFLVNSSGVRISENAVPEPSAAALAGLAAAGLVMRRRRDGRL